MTPLFSLTETLTMRLVTDGDHELLRAWIQADPAHRGNTDAAFFSRQSPAEECYILEDREGPIFFLKLTRAIRLDVQFGPDSQRERMRAGLHEGFPPLEQLLVRRNFAEVVTESKNPALVRSLEKRLRFKRSPSELVRELKKGA